MTSSSQKGQYVNVFCTHHVGHPLGPENARRPPRRNFRVGAGGVDALWSDIRWLNKGEGIDLVEEE